MKCLSVSIWSLLLIMSLINISTDVLMGCCGTNIEVDDSLPVLIKIGDIITTEFEVDELQRKIQKLQDEESVSFKVLLAMCNDMVHEIKLAALEHAFPILDKWHLKFSDGHIIPLVKELMLKLVQIPDGKKVKKAKILTIEEAVQQNIIVRLNAYKNPKIKSSSYVDAKKLIKSLNA